ncbi:MAG TPA: trehalose-6-phosphate synthase [Actinomycetota bacterium]|nr:trehalose-6-phosphate synthase [Actinomycetota bacterium]
MNDNLDEIQVVLVSNRGPVSFVKKDGDFRRKRGAGGLAGALDPVARRLGDRAIWIASATTDDDREALHAGAADGLAELLGYSVYLLDIDPSIYARYYDVVSNRMLWFAVHCLWDELGIKEFGSHELSAWDDAYLPVNSRFARAVLEIAEPDAYVLFQDYHLGTAPGDLRRERPDQTIFHFTHAAFCGPDGLERLPRPIPQRFIEGMLGADLLGFHVPAWCDGFMDCCERIGAKVDREAGLVEHDDRRTWIRPYPIPIDANRVRKRSQRKLAQKWHDRFESERKGPLVVRADRTEPSKNIVRGFKAFENLLDRRPDLRNTRFIACLYPSRQSMPEYRSYAEEIEQTVAAINSRYPDSIDLYMKDDFDRTLGALMVYDALLVNPIMDGMNLVSKEGPTVNTRDGTVVLSTGAGSFMELGKYAIKIDDALDIEKTTAALERALDMPDEARRERAEGLREKVESNKPAHWIEAQLDDLSAIRAHGEPKSTINREDL